MIARRGAGGVSDRDALACLFAAHRRYRRRAFRVDVGGSNAAALKACERKGWVWFQAPDRCSITADGERALEPYGVKAEA